MEFNQEALKRFKSGMWVMFAGFSAAFLNYIMQNVAMFNLDATSQMIVVAGLTAVISQITKILNK